MVMVYSLLLDIITLKSLIFIDLFIDFSLQDCKFYIRLVVYIARIYPVGKIAEKAVCRQKRTPSDCFLAILPTGTDK